MKILLFAGLFILAIENNAQTVTDYDGNVYNTITIGNQTWMAENLRVTKYPNGTPIPLATDNIAWANLEDNGTDDAYCYYNNNASGEANTYGALYTWAAAMGDNAVSSSSNPSGVQGVCPNGWHLPSDDEWKELEIALGMSITDANTIGNRGTNEGSKLAGNSSLWTSGVLTSNAEFGTSGFTALPGGYRSYADGLFCPLGVGGYFWSATEGVGSRIWCRELDYYSAGVYRDSYLESSGFSVRCVCDSLTSQIDGINYDENIQIYPNPASDRIIIEMAEKQSLDLSVYNLVGVIVLQKVLYNNKNEIDISSLSRGIYIIKYSGTVWTVQKKLIVE